jgi:ribose transport system ATP-binding protein
MVGRPLGDFYPPRVNVTGEVRLRVRSLASGDSVREVGFELRAGEILGFAGLIGAGRTEAAEAIVGLRERDSGSIEIDGASIDPRSPRDAMRHGIAYLSEDRKGRGLTIDMGVTENVTLVSLRRYSRLLIRKRAEDAAAREHVDRLRIRVPVGGTGRRKSGGLRKPVRNLSGGNQQKVALAKWLEMQPRVLILDEPTRGVDVGAKREIYDLIVRLASQGMACVFISSELPELLGVCHRIAVMRAGEIADIIHASEATEEKIMHLAAGVESRRSTH